jgi:hypothetical protein
MPTFRSSAAAIDPRFNADLTVGALWLGRPIDATRRSADLPGLMRADHTTAIESRDRGQPRADAKAFAAFLAPLRKRRRFVYAKRPFAGPKAVLAFLSRYTHRVAISNRRLIAVDERSVTFKVKDYRIEGPGRYTTMTPDRASRRNQDRHLMSASATPLSRAAERLPRWSSTGHASARPDRSPALLPTPLASPRAIVIAAHAKPIGPIVRCNHPTATAPRLAPTLIAEIKSP